MRMYKMIFDCVVGSKLHRTDGPDSDTDRRVVYRRHLREQLSPFTSTPDVYQGLPQYSDTTYFELSHFARMLMKGNPTAIEVVHGLQRGGDRSLLEQILVAAMDTEKYVAQGNGLVIGMLKRETPKRLHHAVRMHTHLELYVRTGNLVFDATKYENYSYLMALKRGEVQFDEKYAEKVEPKRIWDTQDLDKVEEMVYNEYIKDLQ